MTLHRLGDRIPELRGNGHFVAPSAAVIGSVILENNVSICFGAVLRGETKPTVSVQTATSGADRFRITTPAHHSPLRRMSPSAIKPCCTTALSAIGSPNGIKAIILNHAVVGKN